MHQVPAEDLGARRAHLEGRRQLDIVALSAEGKTQGAEDQALDSDDLEEELHPHRGCGVLRQPHRAIAQRCVLSLEQCIGDEEPRKLAPSEPSSTSLSPTPQRGEC